MVGIPVAGREVCHTSVVHNESLADVNILVSDDSYMDPARAEDYVEVHLVVADYNLVLEYAPRPAERATTAVDCQMRARANEVRQLLECLDDPH